jgi:hypothetical protein
MRALITRIVAGRWRPSARRNTRTLPTILGWAGLLTALSLGVVTSLAVAQRGRDQPADTQGSTGTDTRGAATASTAT